MAAKITRWTNGTATGNFGPAGNWDNGVPDNSRDASANTYVGVFDGNGNNDPVTAGLNTGVECSGLIFRPSYGTEGVDMLGSTGDPLIIEIDSSGHTPTASDWSLNVLFGGRGNYYFKPRGTGKTDVIVRTPLGPDTVVLSGSFLNKIFSDGGRVRVESLPNSHIYSLHPQAVMVMQIPGSVFTQRLYMEIGNVVMNCQLNTLAVVSGGMVTFNKAFPGNTALEIRGGGVIYNPDSAPVGDVNLTMLGGILDLTQLRFEQLWGPIVIGPDAEVLGGDILAEHFMVSTVAIDLRKVEP